MHLSSAGRFKLTAYGSPLSLLPNYNMYSLVVYACIYYALATSSNAFVENFAKLSNTKSREIVRLNGIDKMSDVNIIEVVL